MDGIIYVSTQKYIESCRSIREKIRAIDLCIDALFLLMLDPDVIAGSETSEYSLDDGQTKIRAVHKGVAGIERTIWALNKLRTYYVNKATGRSFRMIPGINFTGNPGYGSRL